MTGKEAMQQWVRKGDEPVVGFRKGKVPKRTNYSDFYRKGDKQRMKALVTLMDYTKGLGFEERYTMYNVDAKLRRHHHGGTTLELSGDVPTSELYLEPQQSVSFCIEPDSYATEQMYSYFFKGEAKGNPEPTAPWHNIDIQIKKVEWKNGITSITWKDGTKTSCNHEDDDISFSIAVLAHRNGIKSVMFNDPATVIVWKGGESTVVKCAENDDYDPLSGLVMAFMKHEIGRNKGNYCELIKKHVSKPEEDISEGGLIGYLGKIGFEVKSWAGENLTEKIEKGEEK